MFRRKLLSVFVIYAFLLPGFALAQAPMRAPYTAPPEDIERTAPTKPSRSSRLFTSLSPDDRRGRLGSARQRLEKLRSKLQKS